MCEVYEGIFRDMLKDFSVSEGGPISGYCDSEEEVEKLLNSLRSAGFSYSVRSSSMQSSADTMKNKRKYFFQLLQGNVHVPFFGSAFVVERIWSRQCLLGPNYYGKREASVPEHLVDHVNPKKKKRLRIMDSTKSNCPAVLNIKSVRVYPEYTITSMSERSDAKARVLARLRKAVELPEQPLSYLRFYVVASVASEHTHSTESVEASGNIHPLLVDEIKKLVLKGTTSVQVIKLALDRLVENVFTGTHTPGRMNTTFYPTEKTIYSHIYLNLYGKNKTLFDNRRMKDQVDVWSKESDNHIFYRHSTDDNGEVQSLLFCYQNKWQKDLLNKYGDSCLLDATYKTTTYDIPLFFIAVKGNVGYFVVGFFFVQVENGRSIHEALSIFKGWNKDWDPTYWVTDFSESEINAIEQAFPRTKVYLCLFHRRQAWGRWLKKRDNLSVPQDMKRIETMWQHISESPSETEFLARIEELRLHEVSERNPKAWMYFQQQWLSVHERWVKAYENKGNFDTINTTNGVEAMNKMVKHFFLNKNTDKTLTGVSRVLINDFLPSLYKKYCLQNSSIKQYNSDVPHFLHKKTKKFVTHVMQRYATAGDDYNATAVNMISEGLFCVASAKNRDRNYVVNFAEPDCTCDDFQRHKYPCKHFCAIFMFYPDWGFDKMPESYKNHPLISLDETHGTGSSRSGTEISHSRGWRSRGRRSRGRRSRGWRSRGWRSRGRRSRGRRSRGRRSRGRRSRGRRSRGRRSFAGIFNKGIG